MSGSELSLTQPWIREHEQLAPKAWSFYSFDVTPEDYQVVVNVAAELDASCKLMCQCSESSDLSVVITIVSKVRGRGTSSTLVRTSWLASPATSTR